MAKYICKIEAPREIEEGSTWPKWEPIPDLRSAAPQRHMVNVILPQYPGSVVTLYKSQAVYQPATHKRKGEQWA